MIGHRDHMLNFERLELDRCDWDEMDSFPDRVLFQTREWLEFVARTQGAEPVVAALSDGGERIGYFTGLIARRFGVRILGSPLPGSTTNYMGFNLRDGVSRREAAAALPRFAFRSLGCLHLELTDRHLKAGDLVGLNLEHRTWGTSEIDLTPDEDAIFAGMQSRSRGAIRRSVKLGVKIEEASGEEYADEYYAQLEDVFAKQGLRPTYGIDRVRELIRCLEPTGHLLLLRAVSSEGESIATGIFPGMNGTAYFWGGASWRTHQNMRPNEPIFWHAIRYWKARGMTAIDLGGGGDYKRKFGPRELTVPHVRKSRLPGLGRLREPARAVLTRLRTGGSLD
jgi:CelD/BcsL family acetyltransferase involved in cellulose biosynthesis